jgi:hypothetical protein
VGRRSLKVPLAQISILTIINHLNLDLHSQFQFLQLTQTRDMLPLQHLKATLPQGMVLHQRTPSSRLLRPKTINGPSKGINQAIFTIKHMATKPGQGTHRKRVLSRVTLLNPFQ